MKGKLIRLGVAVFALSSCLALAQDHDKDHDRDKMHKHHAVVKHARVYQPKTRSYTTRHRGGTQTVTYYAQRQRTGRRTTTHTYVDRSRPYYHPTMRYSKTEWEARVRAAQNRRKHHTSWADAVVRTGKKKHHRHRTGTTFVRHDNGLHRGWYIGKGNPHRVGSKNHDRDRDHDRKGDHNKDRDHDRDRDKGHGGHGNAMALVNNSGYQLAMWQGNGNGQDRRQGGDRRRNDRRPSRRYAAGHYTSVSRWSARRDHFSIQYVINLSSDGHSRLEATSLEDRNMPNNDRNTNSHGDILRYMHSGHDVIQTGDWDQDGTSVTIHLNRIQYGSTTRSKSETLRGRLSGNSLVVDSFDRNFYGDKFNKTFQKD